MKRRQQIFVQFEDVQANKISKLFGPFPVVQISHTQIRTGENGDSFASYAHGPYGGYWYITDPDGTVHINGQAWSDVILVAKKVED